MLDVSRRPPAAIDARAGREDVVKLGLQTAAHATNEGADTVECPLCGSRLRRERSVGRNGCERRTVALRCTASMCSTCAGTSDMTDVQTKALRRRTQRTLAELLVAFVGAVALTALFGR